MRRFGFAIGCLVAVLVAIEAGIALADTTLYETDDTWLRQKYPTANYHGDTAISVWATASPGEAKWRNGDVQFDLSTVIAPITGATLELYAVNEPGNDGAFHQVCNLVSPSPSAATFDTWTWTSYYAGLGSSYTATALSSLGWYTLPASSPMSSWYDSSAASTSDLSLLNGVRTGSDKVLTLSMESNASGDGIRDWGNTASGYAARLILTTAPEPSSIVLLAGGLLGLLAYAWRKRR